MASSWSDRRQRLPGADRVTTSSFDPLTVRRLAGRGTVGVVAAGTDHPDEVRWLAALGVDLPCTGDVPAATWARRSHRTELVDAVVA